MDEAVAGSAPTEPRVLSIQSHVVSGYVGNKAAVFPLQLLGLDVDVINTVQFSNHTGYPTWEGERLNAEQLWKLCQGMDKNSLIRHSHLLTGYIGSVNLLRTVLQVHKLLKQHNPNLIFVMGDNGKLYVPQESADVYRDEIIPVADFITPNQFECELLTGVKIQSLQDGIKATELLHDKGVETVIITSLFYGDSKDIILLASKRDKKTSVTKKYKMTVPSLPQYFTGTGDLFSALLLAWCHVHADNFPLACEKAIGSIQGVLGKTVEYTKTLKNVGEPMTLGELRLIQSKKEIEDPVLRFHAEEVKWEETS